MKVCAALGPLVAALLIAQAQGVLQLEHGDKIVNLEIETPEITKESVSNAIASQLGIEVSATSDLFGMFKFTQMDKEDLMKIGKSFLITLSLELLEALLEQITGIPLPKNSATSSELGDLKKMVEDHIDQKKEPGKQQQALYQQSFPPLTSSATSDSFEIITSEKFEFNEHKFMQIFNVEFENEEPQGILEKLERTWVSAHFTVPENVEDLVAALESPESPLILQKNKLVRKFIQDYRKSQLADGDDDQGDEKDDIEAQTCLKSQKTSTEPIIPTSSQSKSSPFGRGKDKIQQIDGAWTEPQKPLKFPKKIPITRNKQAPESSTTPSTKYPVTELQSLAEVPSNPKVTRASSHTAQASRQYRDYEKELKLTVIPTRRWTQANDSSKKTKTTVAAKSSAFSGFESGEDDVESDPRSQTQKSERTDALKSHRKTEKWT